MSLDFAAAIGPTKDDRSKRFSTPGAKLRSAQTASSTAGTVLKSSATERNVSGHRPGNLLGVLASECRKRASPEQAGLEMPKIGQSWKRVSQLKLTPST